MSKTIQEIEKQLDEGIPRSVVSERDGGGGRKLSYLEGHYVIDRLNKVFGHLNWSKEIVEIKEVVNTTSKGTFPAYLAKVRLIIRPPHTEGLTYYQENVIKEGYGYGADKSGQNAHELAIKEAVTDGLKVAAKDLGQSMGLALYDKTQENVIDDEEPQRPVGIGDHQ
jgi:DNA repair and recombination protein RAD52